MKTPPCNPDPGASETHESQRSSAPAGSRYEIRDIEGLGDYYIRHLDAMTREGLHSKSDIAAELAWRDCQLEAVVYTVVSIIGGTDYEGNPTTRLNYLQRLRMLVAEGKRMDWLEREGHALEWDDTRPGVVRASDGREFYGDRLRDAIDAAIHDENDQIHP